jgi:dTMP kinase
MSDPLIDFYLFMADRREHIEKRIRPAEQSGKLVVSDRYADSTRAYQPVSLSADEPQAPFNSSWEAKMFIEQTMSRWNKEPDLTLYIDVSVDTAMSRADGDEKYEKRQFLKSVKNNYDAMADTQERIYRVDGEQSEEDVATAAIEIIDNYV